MYTTKNVKVFLFFSTKNVEINFIFFKFGTRFTLIFSALKIPYKEEKKLCYTSNVLYLIR